MKKSQQLEVDLDKTSELLMTTTQQLEEKEKALLGESTILLRRNVLFRRLEPQLLNVFLKVLSWK